MPVLSAAALPLVDWSGFVAGIALLLVGQVTMAEWLTSVRLLMITIVSASRGPPGLGSDTASRSPPGRGHRFAQSAVPWKYLLFHSLCATLLHF